MVFETPCHCGRDPKCEVCEGTGFEPWDRCPRAVAESFSGNAVGARAIVEAYVQFEGRNVLPAPGGWSDQSAAFVRGVHMIDGERNVWEKKRADRQKAQAEAARRG